MTVNELIAELNKVMDKDDQVFVQVDEEREAKAAVVLDLVMGVVIAAARDD